MVISRDQSVLAEQGPRGLDPGQDTKMMRTGLMRITSAGDPRVFILTVGDQVETQVSSSECRMSTLLMKTISAT